MKLFKTTFLISLSLLLYACGGGNDRQKFVKSPIDNLITKYIDKNDFNVMLADMDYKEDTDKYFHKYRILFQEKKLNLNKEQLQDSTSSANDIKIVNTDWQEVSPIIFDDYKNDLGMTILSKKNGILDKNTAPAGANDYVGNSRYGEWQTNSNGSSFWVFYGRYRLMSDLFFGPRYGYGGYYGYPRTYWRDYNSNYRGQRDYPKRGYTSNSTSNSNWSKKPTSFKNKVNSKVTRSASSLKSRGYTSRKSYSKTSRNTNRFSSSSSSRSTSGGFGK